MNFSVEALQEMKNAALRQRTGAGAEHSLENVQQSEEISSSQVEQGKLFRSYFFKGIFNLSFARSPEELPRILLMMMMKMLQRVLSCQQ